MKVVGYIRVSTDRQAEEGLGLEVQEQAIREWARTKGHRIVGMVRDEGISGSNGLDTRLGLAETFSMLRDGVAESLVVYRLDRLARDLVLQEQLLADVRGIGAELFSTFGSEQHYLRDDDADPSRKLIRQVLGAVNEYEKSMVRLRLRAGQKRKAENGGYAGYGPPPLGYRAENGELVKDPSEQATLARIRELHVEGKSTREIARVLTAEGFRPKRANVWHPKSVWAIVTKMAATH